MDVLKDWAMTMAGILILSSMCEVLLPEGSFQKYVRLTIGVVLVIALVAPLKGCREDTPEELFSMELPQTMRKESEETQTQDILTLYRANLEDTMLRFLTQTTEAEVTSVTCAVEENDQERFGTILKITVTVPKVTEALNETIPKLLQENFGVKKENCILKE